MNLITNTTAHRIAQEIERTTNETLRFVEAQLNRIYSLANTAGLQADIMDAFGANGVTALTAYETFRSALSAVKPDHSAPLPDQSVFVPQSDGSVVYVAPVVEEPPAES